MFWCSGGSEGLVLSTVQQTAAILSKSEQKVHHISVPDGFCWTWSCEFNTQMGKERELLSGRKVSDSLGLCSHRPLFLHPPVP